jgi:SAM-dependent methyltransferase
MNIESLLNEKGGIQLDIGCGANKQPGGYVGMDMRPLDGVDIVHNVLTYPWPLPDESVVRAVCSHLVEHIPPSPPDPRLAAFVQLMIDKGAITEDEAGDSLGDWQDGSPRFIRFMDEVWRVVKPGGQFAIMLPHGYSPGQLQDPSHCNPSNESTWAYFDPLEKNTGGHLYKIYRPKPWELVNLYYEPNANMEVLLRKRRDDYSYHE